MSSEQTNNDPWSQTAPTNDDPWGQVGDTSASADWLNHETIEVTLLTP